MIFFPGLAAFFMLKRQGVNMLFASPTFVSFIQMVAKVSKPPK
jgi:hypothetical protein